MRVRRSVLVLVVAAAAVVVGAASYAFACTPTSTLEPLAPGEGARGTVVTVESKQWESSARSAVGPVEIHWGSQTGPVLATAEGLTWKTTVTIPNAPAGYYYIVAVSHAPGELVTQAVTFHLTAPAAVTGTPSGASTQPSSPTPTSSPEQPVSTAGTTASDPAPATAPSSVAAPNSGAVSIPSPSPSTAIAAAPPAPTPTGTSVASATRPVRAPSVQPATTGVAAPAAVGPAAPAATAASPTPSAVPVPQPAKAWPAPVTPSPDVARPSLVSEVPANHGSTGLAAALLVMGTLGLFATGFIVAASRRRVAAPSSSR